MNDPPVTCPGPPRRPLHRSAAHQRTSIREQSEGRGGHLQKAQLVPWLSLEKNKPHGRATARGAILSIRMHLTLLWMLLASGYALSPGTRPGTCRCGARREMLRGAAAAALALAVTPTPALADYGQAAGVKLPAFVPSPIRPTGEMAKTCEVVALGREVAQLGQRLERDPDRPRAFLRAR